MAVVTSSSIRSKRWREKKKAESPDFFKIYKRNQRVKGQNGDKNISRKLHELDELSSKKGKRDLDNFSRDLYSPKLSYRDENQENIINKDYKNDTNFSGKKHKHHRNLDNFSRDLYSPEISYKDETQEDIINKDHRQDVSSRELNSPLLIGSGQRIFSQEEEDLYGLDKLPDGHFYLSASHAVFSCPFTMIIAGPTGCGKSTFVARLLKHKDVMFSPPVKEVRWYHCQTQPFHHKLQEMFPDIIIHEGLPDPRDFDPEIPKLVILDDMMEELCDKRSDLASLFSKKSHHTNSSIIYITQNVFQRNKHYKTAAVNTQHLVLMKNPRDVHQISTLQTQMFGKSASKTGRFLQDIYKHATAFPHSYLLVMTDQYTPNELRIRARIFPDEENYIYGE